MLNGVFCMLSNVKPHTPRLSVNVMEDSTSATASPFERRERAANDRSHQSPLTGGPGWRGWRPRRPRPSDADEEEGCTVGQPAG